MRVVRSLCAVVLCTLVFLWYIGDEPIKKDMAGRMPVKEKKFGPSKPQLAHHCTEAVYAGTPRAIRVHGRIGILQKEQRCTYRVLADMFGRNSIMLKVAACESSLRHTLPDGRLNRGPDGHDVGAFMIRRTVHEDDLRRNGLNPVHFEQNVAFATFLLQRDGLRPWESSRHCWENLTFLS